MVLYEQQDLLFAPMRTSVYGFQLSSGTRIHDWEYLHEADISAVLYMPESSSLVTGTMDGHVMVNF